jgi:hypothetical protein
MWRPQRPAPLEKCGHWCSCEQACSACPDTLPHAPQHELVPLDATVVDVYAGAHAVIFMIGTPLACSQTAELCPGLTPTPRRPQQAVDAGLCG